MTSYIWQSLCLLAHSHRGHKMQMDKVFCAARPVSPSAEHQADCFQCTRTRCFSFSFSFFVGFKIGNKLSSLSSLSHVTPPVATLARCRCFFPSMPEKHLWPKTAQHLCRVQDDNCHAGDVADPRSILGFEHLLNT